MLLFSKSKKEIYDTNIHTKDRIAKDAVEISQEDHLRLIQPVVTEADPAQKAEAIIKAEMNAIIREQAIKNLKASGKLPKNFKDK